MIETCNAKCGNCFSVDRETEPGGRAGVGRGWGSEARVGQTWSVIFFFLVSCDILPRRPPLADAPIVSWGRGRRPGGYDPHAGSVRSSLRTLLRLQNRSCFTPPSCVGCPILPSGERKEYLPLFWRLLSLRLLRNALSRPSK